MIRETDRIRKVAAESLVLDLLPVLDHLDLALQHVDDLNSPFVQGIDMVLKQFSEVLGRHGVEPIPAEGVVFDPNVHEAVDHRPSDEVESDHVMEELQRGYRLGDTVLRPSKVVVSAGSARPADELNEKDEDGAVRVPITFEDDVSQEEASEEETVPEER
jgi:molecular chaperone GrpE